MNLSHNLTLKRTRLSSSGKSNVQKVKSIFWTTYYLGKDLGSKSLDIADKSLNVVSQYVANVHDKANTPIPTNPEIIPSPQYDNLSPELKQKIDDILQDATQKISQIMEDDARRYADDKSDSV